MKTVKEKETFLKKKCWNKDLVQKRKTVILSHAFFYFLYQMVFIEQFLNIGLAVHFVAVFSPTEIPVQSINKWFNKTSLVLLSVLFIAAEWWLLCYCESIHRIAGGRGHLNDIPDMTQ